MPAGALPNKFQLKTKLPIAASSYKLLARLPFALSLSGSLAGRDLLTYKFNTKALTATTTLLLYLRYLLHLPSFPSLRPCLPDEQSLGATD